MYLRPSPRRLVFFSDRSRTMDRDFSDTTIQDAAINLFLTGYSVQEVAKILRLEVAVIRRWWTADPMFTPSDEALRYREAAMAFLRSGAKTAEVGPCLIGS